MDEIETEHLLLRRFTPDDLETFCSILANPDVMRYLGVEAGKPPSRAESEALLYNAIDSWTTHGFSRLAILDKSLMKVIGICGWRRFEGTPELIYILTKEYWGMGLAPEAAKACMRYGFEQLQFDRVMAFTRIENRGSIRVLEKIGMTYVGMVSHTGVEVAGYAITKEDFSPDDSTYVLHRS
jgi:ribosomal-protein-alanine N-acetyltransferase